MDAQPIRILLVDDDAFFLHSLEALLTGQPGLEIVGKAASGKEALAAAALAEPDVAVIDVLMPTMSGIECAGLLQERYPKARVILISGSIFEDKRPHPDERGTDALPGEERSSRAPHTRRCWRSRPKQPPHHPADQTPKPRSSPAARRPARVLLPSPAWGDRSPVRPMRVCSSSSRCCVARSPANTSSTATDGTLSELSAPFTNTIRAPSSTSRAVVNASAFAKSSKRKTRLNFLILLLHDLPL